ncbi:MAG: hypothetical protein A2Y72_07775 [Chloroflexi bacterium RBG_13_53_26]|nr:MAG: hypothetical protein A2Y72_07775 [Chloroflexi bacterium RBG_13_53_26]
MSPENENFDFQEDNDTQDSKKQDLTDTKTAVIDLVFAAWAAQRFAGMFYKMDHAFNHYLENGIYRDDLIAGDLKKLSGGNTQKLIEQLEAFHTDLTKKLVKSLD